jgi:membrane fusion protein (multidrug efflux system)
MKTWRDRLRWPLLIAGPLVVAAGIAWFYFTGGRYESTDNAYVKAAQVSVSANVAGRVSEVDVRDNQTVHKGDVLFRQDDAPFQIAVREARAQLAAARLQVVSMKSTYQQREAQLRAAQSTLGYQQQEFERQQRLLSSGIASKAQFDRAQHAVDEARQQVTGAQQDAGAVLANLGGNANIAVGEHPSVQQAQAALDRAELNLSYATIRAPSDGIATKVEQLQTGDYIAASVPVFTLVSNRDIWVEANFKEVQLTHMRVGQRATITIDTYPDRTFKARIASIGAGTGAQFSVLPAENATGNWVKVVQRVPIRLELDEPEHAVTLRAGLSADVSVDTEHRRWPLGGDDSRVAAADR